MYLPTITGHNPVMNYKGNTYYIPFELCDNGANNGGEHSGADKDSFADNWFHSDKFKMKEAIDLYWLYKECQKRKCNLLLNIPPDTHGLITDDKIKVLMELKQLIDGGK